MAQDRTNQSINQSIKFIHASIHPSIHKSANLKSASQTKFSEVPITSRHVQKAIRS